MVATVSRQKNFFAVAQTAILEILFQKFFDVESIWSIKYKSRTFTGILNV